MKAMRDIGLVLPKSPLRDLVKARDLEFYEGCLLAEFKNPAGDTYIFSWTDADDTANRWLVFRVDRNDLARYMLGDQSLRELLFHCRDGFAYLHDIDGSGALVRTRLAFLDALPEDYVPSPQAMFDPNLMPGDEMGTATYSIPIDGNWEFSDLAEFPRAYEQVFSVVYHFGRQSDGAYGGAGSLKHDIRKGHGFAANRLYSQLQFGIPPESRPQLESVHYASPGVINMQLDSDVARVLALSVAAFVEKRTAIASLYSLIRKNRKEHELTSIEYRESMVHLMEYLDLDVERLTKSTGTMDYLADVLLSYYRRLAKLARYLQSGRVQAF